MVLKNSVYDVMKWIAQILLPALGAFYFGLARIWNLPYPEEIVATITVIDTLLGALLGISTLNYEAKKEAELEEGKRLNGQGQ
jgi:hypothetical protein